MNNIILILMLNHHIRHHKARCSDGGVSPLEAGKYRWFCESLTASKDTDVYQSLYRIQLQPQY